MTVFQRTLRFLQRARIDALQLAILTPQPGTPLYDEFERAGRIVDRDWSHYDFRHTVIRPARMTARQLQDGADWLYRQFYRLDRIILRTIRAAFTVGLLPAYLIWRLNMTYRYDNRREGIVGTDPAVASGLTPLTSLDPHSSPRWGRHSCLPRENATLWADRNVCHRTSFVILSGVIRNAGRSAAAEARRLALSRRSLFRDRRRPARAGRWGAGRPPATPCPAPRWSA